MVRRWGCCPAPKSKIADRPAKDGGNNFGGVARLVGLMDEYTGDVRSRRMAGNAADHWILLFKRHAESKDWEQVVAQLKRE